MAIGGGMRSEAGGAAAATAASARLGGNTQVRGSMTASDFADGLRDSFAPKMDKSAQGNALVFRLMKPDVPGKAGKPDELRVWRDGDKVMGALVNYAKRPAEQPARQLEASEVAALKSRIKMVPSWGVFQFRRALPG